MKASVGASRIRINAITRGCPDGFVLGHRLWTAVKLRGSTKVGYAACRAARDGSYDVSCFHSAYRTCASFRASAMMATWTPRRSAICFAHCTMGSVLRQM